MLRVLMVFDANVLADPVRGDTKSALLVRI